MAANQFIDLTEESTANEGAKQECKSCDCRIPHPNQPGSNLPTETTCESASESARHDKCMGIKGRGDEKPFGESVQVAEVQHVIKTGAGECDDDDDDFLDAIFMAEEGFQDHGFREGHSLGERSGFEQGRQTGHVKGLEVGAEVGFYCGFATMWKAELEKAQDKPRQRVKKVLESLLSMIQDFPLDNPTHEGFWEDLKNIRAKFKQVASLLNVAIDASGGEPTARPTMSF